MLYVDFGVHAQCKMHVLYIVVKYAMDVKIYAVTGLYIYREDDEYINKKTQWTTVPVQHHSSLFRQF